MFIPFVVGEDLSDYMPEPNEGESGIERDGRHLLFSLRVWRERPECMVSDDICNRPYGVIEPQSALTKIEGKRSDEGVLIWRGYSDRCASLAKALEMALIKRDEATIGVILDAFEVASENARTHLLNSSKQIRVAVQKYEGGLAGKSLGQPAGDATDASRRMVGELIVGFLEDSAEERRKTLNAAFEYATVKLNEAREQNRLDPVAKSTVQKYWAHEINSRLRRRVENRIRRGRPKKY